MTRRGLTLLELLIALALVVALGAIAFPVLMRTLDERAFEAAGDVTTNHLLLARAYAQERGEPVEVMYRPDPPRVEARLFRPERVTIEGDELRDMGAEVEDSPEVPIRYEYEMEDEDGEAAIPEGWAITVLPKQMRMTSQLPIDTMILTDGLGEYSPEMEFAEPEFSYEEEQEDLPLRLAVFLPDGSALLGDPAWLSDASGRVGKIVVNPFTGLPYFELVEATDDVMEELAEEEEDEFEEDPPEEMRPDADERSAAEEDREEEEGR